MSFCFVDDDLFEPPWLRLNFLWQVVELAFSKRSTTKKPFRFSTSLYIFYYIAQSVSIDFVGFSIFTLSMMQRG